MSRSSGGRRRLGVAGILLAAILVLALALRLKGIAYGLPYSFVNSDETMVVPKAFHAAQGHLNPQFFFYPSLYFYLTGALYLLATPVWWLLGHGDFLRQTSFVVDQGPYFLLGRLLSVAMGTASVYLVYRLGRDAFGRPAGLIAALLLAAAPLAVAYSHMAVTDMTAVTFSLLALVLLLRAARPAWWCASGHAAHGRRGVSGRAATRRALARRRCGRRRPRHIDQVQPRRARPAGDRGGHLRVPRGGRRARRGRRPDRTRLAAAARRAALPADGGRLRPRVAVHRARRAALPPRLSPPEPDHGQRVARFRAHRQRVLVQRDAQPDGRHRGRAGRPRRRRRRLGALAAHPLRPHGRALRHRLLRVHQHVEGARRPLPAADRAAACPAGGAALRGGGHAGAASRPALRGPRGRGRARRGLCPAALGPRSPSSATSAARTLARWLASGSSSTCRPAR